MDFEPLIQNLDAIDVLGERVDGGVDLAITCSGPLDDSADTLRRINGKILGYLSEIKSQQFQDRFGSPETVKIRILLFCRHPVSAAAQGLINVLAKQAASSGIQLVLDRSAA